MKTIILHGTLARKFGKTFRLSVGSTKGYRWCGTQALPAEHRYELPVLTSDGRVSRNEA